MVVITIVTEEQADYNNVIFKLHVAKKIAKSVSILNRQGELASLFGGTVHAGCFFAQVIKPPSWTW